MRFLKLTLILASFAATACSTTTQQTMVPRYERQLPTTPAPVVSDEAQLIADAIIHATNNADLDSVIKRIHEFISKKPNDPVGYALLGQALQAKKDYPAALQAYQTAHDLRPDLPGYQILIGRVKLLQNNTDGAVSDFQQALQYPNIDANVRVDASLQLAELYQAKNQIDKAIETTIAATAYASEEETFEIYQYLLTLYTSADYWDKANATITDIDSMYATTYSPAIRTSDDFAVATVNSTPFQFLLAKLQKKNRGLRPGTSPTWKVYVMKQRGEEIDPFAVISIGSGIFVTYNGGRTSTDSINLGGTEINELGKLLGSAPIDAKVGTIFLRKLAGKLPTP